jgi:hypothetical protein
MRGVTTNENLRHKWNANRPKSERLEVGTLAKINYFYFGKLPESKIEKYHNLR